MLFKWITPVPRNPTSEGLQKGVYAYYNNTMHATINYCVYYFMWKIIEEKYETSCLTLKILQSVLLSGRHEYNLSFKENSKKKHLTYVGEKKLFL